MKQRIIALVLLLISITSCKEKITNIDQIGNETEIYAVMVSKEDKIIFRQFYNGKTEKDLFNIQSETKSIIAILTGIAIDKGFIKNVDQPISDFFPQILSDKDDKKKEITVRHLLNQTSGLKDFEYPHLEKWATNPNPSNLLLSEPLVSSPGEHYQYNTAGTHLLSVIISKATQMETATFANENLFKPLKISNFKWDKLNDGYHDGGGLYLWMQTDDLIKIGQLVLDNGQVGTTQIVSKSWISELLKKSNKSKAPWGIRNSLHGFCWYATEYNGHDLNYAWGYGGQFIFIFPDLKAIIAINSNHDTTNGIENSNKLIADYLPLLFDKITDR